MFEGITKEFNAAYAGYGKWLGIIIGAVSLLNWLSQAWSIAIPELALQIISAYQAVFHPIIDFLLSWMPWSLPPYAKDALILYSVTGGTVARTYWAFYANKHSAEGRTYGPEFFGNSSTSMGRFVAILLSFLVWPIAIVFALKDPFVFRAEDGRLLAFPEHNHAIVKTLQHDYVCNLRWTFTLQLLAMLAVCAAVVFAGVISR